MTTGRYAVACRSRIRRHTSVTVHARHDDVEQDHVHVPSIDRGQRLLTRRRGKDVVAARGQNRLEKPNVRGLIIDDEDARIRRCGVAHVDPARVEEVTNLLAEGADADGLLDVSVEA
jgi:hypothetical protein